MLKKQNKKNHVLAMSWRKRRIYLTRRSRCIIVMNWVYSLAGDVLAKRPKLPHQAMSLHNGYEQGFSHWLAVQGEDT